MAINTVKKKSAKQEKKTAKEFNGRTQLASGALWGMKGDVRTGEARTSSFNSDDFLIENKYTDKSFYSLTTTVWNKIQKEAIRDNMRKGIMQIDVRELSVVVLDYNDYLELFEDYEIELKEITNYAKSFRINEDDLEPYQIILRDSYSDKVLLKAVVMPKDLFLTR